MLRGVPGGLPDVLRPNPLQGKSDYVQILMLWSWIRFFPLQVLSGGSWMTPFSRLPDRKKIVSLSPRDLRPAPKDVGQWWDSHQQIGHSWKLILRKAQQTAREESIRKRRKMVVKMVKPFLRLGYSRPFQLTLVHVRPRPLIILQARAGNLLSLIVLGTMILGLIWRDCYPSPIRLLEISGEFS